MVPDADNVPVWTDQYFNYSKRIAETFGDAMVTYATFMRRPVRSAPRLAIEWLHKMATDRGTSFEIEELHEEGKWVGAGEPLLFITGSLSHLVDLETLFLQKLGPACVTAYNACMICMDLPNVAFLAFDARHCAGTEMAEMMAYAASVGSAKAREKVGAKGFIGNATTATAHYFGQDAGLGTMPHAIIGYAGSTVRAAEMFHETFPEHPMTVLVDYYGLEITDSIAVCQRFPEVASQGKLSVRIDTPGGRYVEGLDPPASYAVLERNAPHAVRGYRTESQLRYLIGTGVSAAAIWHLREQLDKAGFPAVKVVGSSGFGPEKCKVMAEAAAPLDVVGTGSFLPEKWSETYATADIIDYNGKASVKVGREFLLPKQE